MPIGTSEAPGGAGKWEGGELFPPTDRKVMPPPDLRRAGQSPYSGLRLAERTTSIVGVQTVNVSHALRVYAGDGTIITHFTWHKRFSAQGRWICSGNGPMVNDRVWIRSRLS